MLRFNPYRYKIQGANIVSRRKYLEVNTEWCKGCRICVAFCPQNVLELNDADRVVVARPDDCNYCGDCEIRCPDFAIVVVTEKAS
jgi:2-oxoglutarate ferredoxin oxidoreductase subunit delta